MALMNGARVSVAAQAVGIAQGALASAREYAAVRQQFGRPIEEIPPVADMLVEMTLQVEAARALLYETARIVDEAREAVLTSDRARAKRLDRLAGLLTPMVKYFAGEMSIRVANDAVQILGGSGYMRDYPVERYLRDARITTIYEGTSQLQVVAAIRGVTAGMAEARFQEMEAALPDGVDTDLKGTLATVRDQLAESVEAVKDSGDSDYIELVARPVVDLMIAIYIGYLLLAQGASSPRKKMLAARWIGRLEAEAETVDHRIRSGERSALDAFGVLVAGEEPA
jgi:hypothetical protein